MTFTTGLLWPRILASMALPVAYPPLRAMGSYLIDGGVIAPVPVQQCRLLGAGRVIAVRLTAGRTAPRRDLLKTPSAPFAMETLFRTLEIMHNRISETSRHEADVTIEVCLDGGGLSDFKRGPQYSEVGYKTTMDARKQLSALLVGSPAS